MDFLTATNMTDPELARETTDALCRAMTPHFPDERTRARNESIFSQLILATFARTEDKRRVDWLAQQIGPGYAGGIVTVANLIPVHGGDFRSAIDAAMGATLVLEDEPPIDVSQRLTAPDEPPSLAIPITPETVVPFRQPCQNPGCPHMIVDEGSEQCTVCGHSIETDHAPTCRPTEGGA